MAISSLLVSILEHNKLQRQNFDFNQLECQHMLQIAWLIINEKSGKGNYGSQVNLSLGVHAPEEACEFKIPTSVDIKK